MASRSMNKGVRVSEVVNLDSDDDSEPAQKKAKCSGAAEEDASKIVSPSLHDVKPTSSDDDVELIDDSSVLVPTLAIGN